MRVIIGFAVAVVVAVLLGTITLSWFDQAGFTAAGGGELTAADRLVWWFESLKGMGVGVGLYPMLMAVGLAIAFLAANFAQWFAPGLRFWWYAGAGAVALVTMVLLLKAVLGLFVLPGARTIAGVAAQGAVGFIAGAVYALMTPRPRAPR